MFIIFHCLHYLIGLTYMQYFVKMVWVGIPDHPGSSCAFREVGVVKSVKPTPIQVSFALLVFLISFVAHVGAFTYYFFSIREDVWKWLVGSTGMVDDWWMRATVLSSSFLPIAAVLGPTILYIGIGLMKDIDCLRIQLSCF